MKWGNRPTMKQTHKICPALSFFRKPITNIGKKGMKAKEKGNENFTL